MRIGIDGRRVRPGKGPERYSVKLIEYLSKIDNKNEYILFTDNDISPFNIGDNFRKERLFKRFHFIHKKNIAWYGRLFFGDLDLFHFPTADVWYSKYRPTVVTLHDLTQYKYPEKFFADNIEYLRYKEHLDYINKNADFIITVSEYTRQDIIETLGISADRIFVTYDGIDFSVFSKSDTGNEVLKRLQISSPFVLYAGGLDFRKNIESIIKAFKQLKDQLTIAHKLVIAGKERVYAGKESYKDFLVNLARELNIESEVLFTGYVIDADLRVLYSRADIFVFPSIAEGFGMPPLEAMACGCPVVTSNSSSLPEICGKAAILANPHDVNDIAGGMQKILSDDNLRSELIKKGFERVKDFSWETTARKTLEIYGRVAS